MIKPTVLAVTGCTASGKSTLALALAQALNGEILCMDSMQIYRRMDIGTAKPSREEQAAVPHHLLDLVEPWESFAVADYVKAFEAVLPEVIGRGHTPVLVGGTGLYLKSLIHGMTLGTAKSDAAVRARYEALAFQPQGRERLHAMLAQVDPDSAARLHPNDLRRVIRALEVFELTGTPMSRQKREEPERPYRILPIALHMPREALYRRIEKRVDQMLAQGLIEEVQSLLDSGVSPDCQAMQAIGYKELVPVARGKAPAAPAVEQLILNTKHYAKRQETWCKGENETLWLEADENALKNALALWESFQHG